jgi:trans-aconitate 2-methyltransferase
MSWSAKQYTVFEDERTRPVRDLVAAIPSIGASKIVDIGCGPGNSTEVLMARFPEAEVSGFDSSTDMIAAAKKRLPQVKFEVIDVSSWSDPGPFGVILANAVLQWVPDHLGLFPRLIEKLALGGSLAVQMPDNLGETAHRLMREVAANGPWAGKLARVAGVRTKIEDPVWYYGLLKPSCARVEVWRTTYYHSLANAEAIVEWFKGSGLRPFLGPLEESEREEFLADYLAAVRREFPPFQDGSVLLPFPRQFIVATR